jgi:hypothetical protein
MSDTTTIMPPVEPPQDDEASPIRIHIPRPKTILIIVLVVLLAVAIGALGAGTYLLGHAHGATGHAQAQYSASQSQLDTTEGQLSSAQSQLSASQAALSAQQGSDVVGTWTGTASNGWTGTITLNADHSLSSNGVVSGTVENESGTWSIVTPGSTMTWVEPTSNTSGDDGWVVSYTINGNTMTVNDSVGDTFTLTK